ncbi:MAG: hypothetical protein HY377_02430 [Candidatus Blackburnbacteria bacterium]|nr:hypothetical protein [Candidatus Blackburnbacteria bacterium]
MGFWGPNGHDGVWHIALINHLARGSFAIPVFSGEIIRNYHIGFDLILAFLNRATGIPAQILYFQIVPLFLSLAAGFVTYKLVLFWKNSRSAALWATFFVYFGGNFGWILTLIRSRGLGGESMFWSQQAISTLINPPFATSIVLMLLGIYFLAKYDKSRRVFDLLATVIVFGLLGQIKVYAGILAIFSLLVIAVLRLLAKRDATLLGIFVLTAAFSVALFLPLNRGSSQLLVFQPFWFLETMMALSDRLDWHKFYEAMTTYRAGEIWTKAILAYGVAFGIFLIGNMGTRMLGVIEVFRIFKKKEVDIVAIFLSSVGVTGVILPMLFLQKGTPWNTIQFFYYTLVAFGILAGVSIEELLKKMRSKKAVVVVIVLLTIPSTIATLKHYLPGRPPAKISNEELSALAFLQQQGDGVVLTYPYDQEAAKLAESSPPRPLYLYESTAYVAAFSNKPVYLEDEVNLNIMDYPWRARRIKVEEFLATLEQKVARDFLRENEIKYVYWVGKQRARLGEGQLGLTQIFENKEVKIYRVD